MLRQLVLQKKIDTFRAEETALLEEDSQLEKRAEDLTAALEEAGTEEEIGLVNTEVEELEAKKSELNDRKVELETKIQELEGQLAELNAKEPDMKRGAKNMELNEVREAINMYVRDEAESSGFTSVEGGALIPEELLTPVRAAEDVVDLTRYVRVVKVNSGAGSYPVIKKSGSVMSSVEELAQNPELAKPTIEKVAYEIATYRGYIPVSQEVIDDADYDVTGLIADEIVDQERNTKNAKIAAILKTAPAKSAAGLDGIKTVMNKDLKKIYSVKLYVSASLYNALDLLKDDNGRYLLQDDITAPSGKSIKGREVIVLDDDMIGAKTGDLVGFIGDAKAFCTLFDRKRNSVKWVDNDIYGQLLAGFTRFDTKAVDTDAGYYVTYTEFVEPEA